VLFAIGGWMYMVGRKEEALDEVELVQELDKESE
jgi:hypothetical protein